MAEKAAWTERRKTAVRAIYAAAIGTVIVIIACVFGWLLLADGDLTIIEAGFVVVLLGIGLVAALPGTFMTVIHWLIDAWQLRRSSK